MVRKLSLPDSAAIATGDGRRVAPSAERNAEAIEAVLRRIAPPSGRVLEIASGTGQHIARFAAAFPALDWQPSDANPEALVSIRAWVAAAGLANLRPTLMLDAGAPGWTAGPGGYALVQVVNLLHLISAAEAAAVLRGIAGALVPGGTALIYGPFRRDGQLTSAGDARFDASLRAQDPAIGYKDDGWVVTQAAAAGLALAERIEMPANNLAFVLRVPGG